MRWTVSLLPSAARQLAKLDHSIRRRIADAVAALTDNPRPPGSKKLVGLEAWRIRVGAYRVVYQIEDDELVVLVVRIGHRRDVYH